MAGLVGRQLLKVGLGFFLFIISLVARFALSRSAQTQTLRVGLVRQ